MSLKIADPRLSVVEYFSVLSATFKSLTVAPGSELFSLSLTITVKF
jgi:hypothetical protein